MKRSELLGGAAALSLAAGLDHAVEAAPLRPLTPTAQPVPVAFLVSEGAVMIDFAGPWEVFQDASIPGRSAAPFSLYTVAETTKPLTLSAGAKLVPNYDFASAPAPKVVVVPGQSPPTKAMKDWLHRVAPQTDLVMSVCVGALLLAEAGMLDGHAATTHHASLSVLAMQYPKVHVIRGARFVDEGPVATSAGLTAGIDLALHVVERYYGRGPTRDTAYYMEYLSTGWMNPNSNTAYAKPPVPRPGDALCPVCWMDVSPKSALTSTHAGKPYYFCSTTCQSRFALAPERFLHV